MNEISLLYPSLLTPEETSKVTEAEAEQEDDETASVSSMAASPSDTTPPLHEGKSPTEVCDASHVKRPMKYGFSDNQRSSCKLNNMGKDSFLHHTLSYFHCSYFSRLPLLF